jgi:hypothetical protein
MGWPSSPVDGQTATVNGIIYVYRSAKNAWGVASISAGNTINYSGNVSAANVSVTGNVFASGQRLIGEIEMITYTLAL